MYKTIEKLKEVTGELEKVLVEGRLNRELLRRLRAEIEAAYFEKKYCEEHANSDMSELEHVDIHLERALGILETLEGNKTCNVGGNTCGNGGGHERRTN